jgi:purine-cytosine permease-like protein
MDNPGDKVRCASCGEVDVPDTVAGGPGWIAVALWALAALVWALGFAVARAWLSYVAAIAFFIAFVYTLWYLFRRERACRHCGGRRLDPVP